MRHHYRNTRKSLANPRLLRNKARVPDADREALEYLIETAVKELSVHGDHFEDVILSTIDALTYTLPPGVEDTLFKNNRIEDFDQELHSALRKQLGKYVHYRLSKAISSAQSLLWEDLQELAYDIADDMI